MSGHECMQAVAACCTVCARPRVVGVTCCRRVCEGKNGRRCATVHAFEKLVSKLIECERL